jgi:crotonobetainyl-CoA hydratase
MLDDVGKALADAATDPRARVVLVQGAGAHFCAGADLSEVGAAAGPDGFGYGRALEDVLSTIAEHPLPVVARAQGAALGAGCQLLVACDLAVAAEDARIGIPSARLGIVIAFESIERLALAVGPGRAAEILLVGREVSGREAAEWGLVNEAVPHADLDRRVGELLDQLVTGAPLSIRASKRGIRAVLGKQSIDRESEGYRVADFDLMAADALASEDLREGLEARRGRRPPQFRGT